MAVLERLALSSPAALEFGSSHLLSLRLRMRRQPSAVSGQRPRKSIFRRESGCADSPTRLLHNNMTIFRGIRKNESIRYIIVLSVLPVKSPVKCGFRLPRPIPGLPGRRSASGSGCRERDAGSGDPDRRSEWPRHPPLRATSRNLSSLGSRQPVHFVDGSTNQPRSCRLCRYSTPHLGRGPVPQSSGGY